MMFFQKKTENPHTAACGVPLVEHCAMALSLDMERQIERIIIGDQKEIARYFEGCTNPEPVILVDEVRPMGTMISELFETRPTDATDAATGFRPDTVHHRPDLLYKAVRVIENCMPRIILCGAMWPCGSGRSIRRSGTSRKHGKSMTGWTTSPIPSASP